METEISIMWSLKLKNSAGCDEVLFRILRHCASEISKPFHYICNSSFQSGIYPERLEYSVVKPIYKKGNKPKMTNYWPLSLLTTFSRIRNSNVL